MPISTATSSFIQTALDPRQSVVIEACAGSGKTWLLVSRMLRLLLEGTAPSEILAITYTRKAAREIDERLRQWLEFMAIADTPALEAFLCERAIPASNMQAMVSRARGLYETVLFAPTPMTVSTFHGWFARLLQGMSLSSGIAGFTLQESGYRIMNDAWQRFANSLSQGIHQRQDTVTLSLLWLWKNIGANSAKDLIFRLADRRGEWQYFVSAMGAGGTTLDQALARLKQELGVSDTPIALINFFADRDLKVCLNDYAQMLASSEKASDLESAKLLADLPEATEQLREQRFQGICKVLLTTSETLKNIKPGPTLDKRFTPDGALRFIALHNCLGTAVLTALEAQREEQAYEFNYHALTVGIAFLDALDKHKQERRLLDFTDIESIIGRLLRDEEQAAYLQAKLDARYKHILLDEFQDTNPLQWRILLSWLSAYGQNAIKPCVFVVGDPKQSIYRFRRAEPRVFQAAAQFFSQEFSAKTLSNDLTRRNAPAIVAVANQLFGNEPGYQPFRAHQSTQESLQGIVEILPLIASTPLADANTPLSLAHEEEETLRNPLLEPRQDSEDNRRCQEAAQLVQRLQEVVGHYLIQTDTGERFANYGDVMILTRRRSVLPMVERALRAAGIAYHSVGRGGLLKSLEALDLIALLRFLLTPTDNLVFAHVLRSPMFGASDEDLQQLAQFCKQKKYTDSPSWWAQLTHFITKNIASVTLPSTFIHAFERLTQWREAAIYLPVHDLLDRIMHQSDLLACYAKAVPSGMWSGVRANFEAFIALALELDAGRYPNLIRFLSELNRLAQAENEESPDEGIIHAETNNNRVRILTIHAAKGLESPIVWLIDAHNTHRHHDAYSVLLDWPPDAAQPRHFSLYGNKTNRGKRREALFAQEHALAEREELNLLYVALTRAKQYFFASGIESAKNSRPSAYQKLEIALAALTGFPTNAQSTNIKLSEHTI